MYVVEFLEAYQLDNDKYTGNIRRTPLGCPIH